MITLGMKLSVIVTRLPASRSSSIGPEGRFSFFHPKIKVKARISLSPHHRKNPFLVFYKIGGGEGGVAGDI